MRKRRIKSGLLVLFCLLQLLLRAQPGQYPFTHIDISRGLSNNQVTSIFKDSKGFLWFGTMAGLNRYDGYKFRVFRHDPHDSTSLNDDFINRVLEGPEGKIWVDTRNGFTIYDPLTETFNNNLPAYLSTLSLPNVALTQLVKDSNGDYWFLMAQQGLYKYISATKKTILLYQRPQADIAALAEDGHGSIWLVHSHGLLEKIDTRTGKLLAQSNALHRVNGEDSLGYAVFIDGQQELWMYVPGNPQGIYHFTPATDAVQHIDKDDGVSQLNTNLVIGVLQDNKDRIWICTDHGGVNVLDKTDYSIRYLVNNTDDDKSIAQNSITTAYKDNAGIIWLGTYKKGVSYYHESIIKFPLIRHQPSHPNSLSFDDVNRFVEDARGNLWIGTNGGGLIYYNRENGTFKQYLHQANNPNSIGNDVIVSLWVDRQQKLWIGSYFGGLDCYDGKTFTHYKHRQGDSTSLSDDRVWEIFEDSKNNLWVGTLAGGLNRFDRKKNVFYHYTLGMPNSIGSNYIATLLEDHAGNLWIGTANGVDVLGKTTGRFVHFALSATDSNSLSNDNIISMLEDSRGLMWVGTRDGLDVFDNNKKTFQTFRTVNGLPSSTIENILEDDEHRLWISTPNGISCMKVDKNAGTGRVSLQCRNYDELDGLQGTEFNENAAFKTSKGELIFGGANGFNIFHPENIVSDKAIPSLVLTDLQVFNHSVGIGEEINGRVLLPQAISATKAITLRYDDNVLSIEFAALNYSNTEKNQYAYKLDGFNKNWLVTDGNMRKATYTNLDPGDYTFHVKAANDEGQWNEKGIALQIKILPPFWRTPLAYMLYVFLLVGILWFSRQLILQRARMRFEIEQQRQEAQRMHELDMMKIKFFTNVSHEFRTPLSLILTPLDKMIRTAGQPDQKKQFQLIHRNARRLLNLVNQLLDFRKMEVQELRLNATTGDIVRFIRDISYSFTDMAEKKNIRFLFQSSVESLAASFDNDKLERILFNLLSNAFKFTPENGAVTVQLDLQSKDDRNYLAIRVTDTGIGIPVEKQEKIFERFFQYDIPGSMVNQGSGIGLAITKEFVKLHEGMIDVESEPDKGSCFTVLLPVLAENELPVERQQAPAAEASETEAWETGENGHLPETEPPADHEHHKNHGSDKRATILLVEDNEDFRFYLKDNFRNQFNIIEAANGREGWQKALGYHPDLVVSDISMPEMNGIELCKKIKKDRRTSHIPVILLTALMGEEQQLRGLETGADDYMTKPFNFEILQSRIRNILNGQMRLRKVLQKRVDVNPADISPVSPDEQFIHQALELVEKNISEPDFSVEDMSKALYMSRVALYKKLIALTGKTPIEFIRSIRLKRAAQLLEKSQMSVAEIAYEVGFNNPKYFARYFKEEFNMVPSAYVNEYRKKNGEHRSGNGPKPA
ncbi:MAG TPA: two-component regulator propeller domain-containing protein [Chitinophagaceae bacterium]